MSLSQYLLEFSICLALFYGLYHFLLRKETFFQLNRWYLLLSPAFSMIIPFLDWELPSEPTQSNWDQLIVPVVSDIQQQQTAIWENLEKPPVQTWTLTYLDLLLLIYLVGVCWMGAKLLHRTWRLMKLIGRGKQEAKPGYTVVTAEEKIPASSFLSYIFWEDGPLSSERRTVLEHELVHVRQWHSLDVLLMEIWVMLKWFHPFIYWYRNSLRLTHEYIADAYVSTASGSRLEYAKLLTNTRPMAVDNHLLHQFNSALKMRLLMLAKHSSKKWKYLKFTAMVPVTGLLLLLFSFNLAEELPDPIVKPLVEAGWIFNDAVRHPVLPKTIAAPRQDKNYQLQWGDLACACESEQFPNLYLCENQSLKAGELRRLISAEGGFQLTMEGQPQRILELTAVSKYMKDMGGFQGQFDEMGQSFNVDSPLWKQVKKGDVFRFTFTNPAGDHFQFEVVVNNAREAYPFGARIEIGAAHYSLSTFNSHLYNHASGAVVHMDVEELKQLVRSPMKIRKDEDTYYKIASVKIVNRRALRAEEWKNINSSAIDLSRSKSILEAYPGDQIGITLTTEKEEGNTSFLILIREKSSWDGRKRAISLEWGDLNLEQHQNIVLSKAEITDLSKKEMYLLFNGGKYLVKPKAKINGFFISSVGEVEEFEYRSYIEKMVKTMKPGEWLYLGGFTTAGDYISPGFRIYLDQDWQAVFAGHPNVSFSEDGRQVVIENAQPEDLGRVLDLEGFTTSPYKIEVDGISYGPGNMYNKANLRKLVEEQQLPQQKLVISRRACLNCPGE